MTELRQDLSPTPGKAHLILTWFARIALALFFLAAAVTKFMGIERQIVLFDKIGWGQWFRYFTGATELIAAVLLLVPTTGLLGALGTAIVSVGALATLIALGRPVTPALITLAWSGGLILALRNEATVLVARIRSR